tara:strand:+ start:412 stop:711 length:300 start_codon:yes stop_codon:yes gene_type:complete
MDFSNMNQSELKFFTLIAEARNSNFDINKIVKKDPIKQEEKRKILSVVRKIINDNEIIEMGFLLYKKNKIIKYIIKFLLNYYIKCFKTQNNNQIDLLFD